MQISDIATVSSNFCVGSEVWLLIYISRLAPPDLLFDFSAFNHVCSEMVVRKSREY